VKILIVSLLILFAFQILLASDGGQLIGTPAPEWNNQQWINSQPLHLSDLKGKVILVRFFMDSSCPLCRASAPYLNEFFDTFNDRGLIIIGMFTPKPAPRSVPISDVRKYVKEYGFQFPVALDNDWATLNKFWLDRVPDADFTSVSFLIDKKGIVRYIHKGGQYDREDAKDIRKKIEELLNSTE
jgi:peroxiredoxin